MSRASQAGLFRVYSREDALQKAETGADRRLIETALRFYATEDSDIGVTYSGFCIISLPHKPLKNLKDRWERRISQSHASLTIEPGSLDIAGRTLEFGVPYGSTARLIMIYLQTEALRHNSKEIVLGRSMYDWLNRMGISIGGNSYRQVREQAMRIAACSLRFTWDGISNGRRANAFKKDSIIQAGMIFLDEGGPQQGTLWEDTIMLSETFFQKLQEHPVPINVGAIRGISNRSLAIDIYVWLAYRLHTLAGPVRVLWPQLMEQFGQSYKQARQFRPKFLESLQFALVVYPEAQVEWDELGLTLRPSPPAIPQRRFHQVLLPGRQPEGEPPAA